MLPIVRKPLPAISVDCDSRTTIDKVRSVKYNAKTKRHIQVRLKSIRGLLSDRIIAIEFIGTQDNIADPLTKGIEHAIVLKSRLGMRLIDLLLFYPGSDIAAFHHSLSGGTPFKVLHVSVQPGQMISDAGSRERVPQRMSAVQSKAIRYWILVIKIRRVVVVGQWFGLLSSLEDMWAMRQKATQLVVEKGSKSRVYNNMFALCSFGGMIDDSVNKGKGPYVFCISGKIYHNFGSLIPPDGCKPKFAQLYMYDSHEAIDHRLNFSKDRDDVDASIVATLQEMIDYVYNNVVDSFRRGYIDATDLGKCVILPSSFTGVYRYMQQNFQDSLAICKEYGHPDLSITFTCNPKWEEIQGAIDLAGSQTASVRPYIVAWVFKIKLDVMMDDFTKNNVLGQVLAVVYTVEFQKWGLPHAHIVLWLRDGDKLITPEDIDAVICAELPDKDVDPVAYKDVSQFMMHGPCGEANPKCSWLLRDSEREGIHARKGKGILGGSSSTLRKANSGK
ncbi:hypothetical protein AgCh_017845 [Apium graveolens]